MHNEDFDYNEFIKFMNNISGFDNAVILERKARCFDIIETHDVINDAVMQMQDFPEAENMLQKIGIKVK